METHISKEGILTVKALVMSKKIFDQLEQGRYDAEILGVVNLGVIWYVGISGSEKLVRVTHREMIERFLPVAQNEYARWEREHKGQIDKFTLQEVPGPYQRAIAAAQDWMKTLPQIFIK